MRRGVFGLLQLLPPALSVLTAHTACEPSERIWDRVTSSSLCPTQVRTPKQCYKPASSGNAVVAGKTPGLSLYTNYFDRPEPVAHKYLVVATVGASSVAAIEAVVNCWGHHIFDYILFHYDANLAPYTERDWYSRVVGIHAKSQFKFWYFKRFLTPSATARYERVLLVDADAGLRDFDVFRYLLISRRIRAPISQPGIAIGGRSSDWHVLRVPKPEGRGSPARWVHVTEGGPFVSFTAEAWACIWGMVREELVSGHGVDMMWCGFAAQRCGLTGSIAAASGGNYACAVVDETPVHHLDTHEGRYDGGKASLESHQYVHVLYPDVRPVCLKPFTGGKECNPAEATIDVPERSVSDRQPAPHFLVVISVFKNEASVMREWIQHHIWQGVDHFYLLDNGSTDDYLSTITGYLGSYVSIVKNVTKHAQVQHLSTLLAACNRARWLMSIDLDEFVYARPRSGQPTIASYLRDLERTQPTRSHVELYWRMFGSSGHVRQPPSVREAFIRSADEVEDRTKYIVRRSAVSSLGVHHPGELKWGERVSMKPVAATLNLALNHYAIMSRERFMSIKMTRGDVASHELEAVRSVKYFDSYERISNGTDNTELRDLIPKEQRVIG